MLGWLLYPVEENLPLPRIETDLNAVYAPDSQRIWAVGNLGLVVHSEDGGRTWTQQRVSTSPPQTSPTATATPQPSSTPSSSPSPQETPSPQAATLPEDLMAVIFNDEQHGWIAGRNGTLYATDDGGQNWYQRAPQVFAEESPATLGSVSFRTEDGVYTMTSRGELQFGPGPDIDLSDKLYLKSEIPVKFTDDGDLDVNGSRIPLLDKTRRDRANLLFGKGGALYQYTPQKNWQAVESGTKNYLRDALLVDAKGWAVGDGGTIIQSSDTGATWKPQTSHVQGRLNGVFFTPDSGGLRGWAVGYNGILATSDGGEHWVRVAIGPHEEQPSGGAYKCTLPRWYFLSWPLAGLLLLPVLRRRGDVQVAEESVADVLVSDRPLEAGDPDPLQFQAIALGLSRFLRNEKTVPPLTIAITGEWGTGKSSLMNLLRADLREYGFRPVWFNAWHHQKEEHLLASLLQNVRLQAVPRAWRPVGLMFRARLLGIRGWRHWLPVSVLLFVATLLTGYAVARFKAGGVAPDSPVAFITNFFNFEPGNISQAAPRLALLASVASVLIATWKGVTAFGVNPASLLATVSRSMRLRDLDAQTSFRKKFAEEFSDVTQALRQRSMIIFIDDLDRCRPENVLDTLEAVNFLVSSGDCFVIIGMARERVERCVGLSFKDVAEEVLDSSAAGAQPEGGASDEARRKRAEFARQYLDKLINIEVPVPVPTANQSRELLVATEAEPLPELWRRWQQARKMVLRVWPVAVASLILSAGFYAGIRVHRHFHDPSGQKSKVAATAATPTTTTATTATATTATAATTDATPGDAPSTDASAAAPPAETSNDGARRIEEPRRADNIEEARRADNSTPTPMPDEAELRKQTQTPVLTAATPARRPLISYWPLPLGLILLFAVVVWLLTRRPDLVVKDSEEFETALRIWHPLVFRRHKTPRALKRFMNRVRYLAMRERPQQESQSRWERMAARLARRFGIELTWASSPVGGNAAQDRIPESALVALAAIQQLVPGWLENEQYFQQRIINNLMPADHDLDALTLLREAKEAHEQSFYYWSSLQNYREAFLKMSADIRVN